MLNAGAGESGFESSVQDWMNDGLDAGWPEASAINGVAFAEVLIITVCREARQAHNS